MADYPTSIFTPRVVDNVPGQTLDPTKTTRVYAEDVNLPNDEIVAIETVLGTSPQGSYADVKARLVADEAAIAGKQAALGFTPEDVANKKTAMSGNESSNTYYLSVKAIYDWVTGLLGSYVPTTRTVNSHALSGNVTVTASDVGLGSVDNTSDSTKNSATATLTNKRITKRVLSLSAGSATPSINTDSYDVVHITSQSAAITSFTTNLTGTPNDGDTLRISITDDGTARALTWGSKFEASTVALPTTTVISTRLEVGFVWNTETTKWRCVAVA